MKIACIGIGAVGSIIARELKKLNIEITLYSRTPKSCFTVLEDGHYTTYPYIIHPLTEQISETYDVIFIAVKATSLEALAPIIPKISHPSTEVVLCENGMGYDHFFQNAIPSVVYISGQKHEDYVEHFRDSRLIIADKPYLHVDLLIDMINNNPKVELDIEKNNHFEQLRFEKLLINLGVNSMTALTQNTAQIFKDENIIHLTKTLLEEGRMILNQHTEIISEAFIEEAIELYKSYPDHMGTSMYYDVMNKANTEYQFIQKYFYDHKKDIDTPVLDVIYALLKGYHIKN
jgi:2-dehydropantoate 2-reductase